MPARPKPPTGGLSRVSGANHPELLNLTFGQLCEQQAQKFGSRDAVVVAWSHARITFSEMNRRSKDLAKGLLALGVQRGDGVAIFSGDDEKFIELFFAVARIGAILVIFNKGYTIEECERAIKHTGPVALFVADEVNRNSTEPLIQHLRTRTKDLGLKNLVRARWDGRSTVREDTWESVLTAGNTVTAEELARAEAAVDKDDVVNIQFTSGTTGSPKAAMLTHYGLVNNGKLIGDYLEITEKDIVCCAPPLFHCFGLVAGMVAAYSQGAAIVYANRDFDAVAVVDVLVKERATVLHGVPTMFIAMLQHMTKTGIKIDTVWNGIAAGTTVPPALLKELRERLGYKDITICYGMTETSPTSFMTKSSDSLERKLNSVGQVFPHVGGKIVDAQNRIVPLGERGEVCVSGWLLQKGYYRNPEKTNEAMIRDEDGVLWMHTGDEGTMDAQGYCSITGRIKDIIIRGGENIYPQEIEERILEHPAINASSVVGLKDDKYGESVAAFLGVRTGSNKPSLAEIKSWVEQRLARHKAPVHLFWVGPSETVLDYPLTGNGKIRKESLREIGNKLLKDSVDSVSAKL